MRHVVHLLIGSALLAGCAGQPAPRAAWRFDMGQPAALELAREKLRCVLSTSLPDGTYLELANHFGGFLLGVTRHGSIYPDLAPATVTLAGSGGTLTLPGRPLVGGVLVAPLSDASDPDHRLVSVISSPFRLTGQVAGRAAIDERLPAVPPGLRQAHAACLLTAGKIAAGQAIVGHDAAGGTTYTVQFR